MKTITQFKRKPLASLIALSLVTVSVAGTAYAAAPLAGTEIKNLATVSYEDENGNTYTAQSNEAVITVAPQYRATLENDRTQSGAPGQTVYFPHTIVNTGNTPDTYALAATDGSTSALVYEDTNGNGQPDAGEDPVTTITLDPGATAHVVVAYDIPSTAASGSSSTVTLTATSGNAGGIVKDIGTNSDSDADDQSATNTDVINVTSGPVLVLNKEANFDAASNKVTYTLTVKNTGGSDAKLVDIIDAVPRVDTDGTGSNMQSLTNVTIESVNGLLTGNGDTVPAIGAASFVQVDETVIGADMDGDGLATNTAVDVIQATDAVIPPNTTVSVIYSANYNTLWKAGESIDNTFVTYSDNDDDGTKETTTTSNTTHNVIPQTYSVDAEDDKVNPAAPSPGVNDGNDDDSSPANDVQVVDKVASGDTVIFTHVISNTGNGDDIFNLTVANTDFPSGTVFTLWNADGTVQLTDSSGNGGPDTGVLSQNGTKTVVVKADLPAGASGTPAGGYNAVLTAASNASSTATDTTTLKLNEITAPSVDLAAVTVDNLGAVTSNASQVKDGFNDAGVADAHDEGPVLFANAALGETVVFPMAVANESGSSDSFMLGYEDLPTGWTVVFKDTDGNTVTATPFLPAGGTFNYSAYVTVSNDPTEALGDSSLASPARTGDADGYDASDNDDQNASGIGASLSSTDGDKDYVIKFTVTSSVDSARQDEILHGIDVNDSPSIAITPDGQNQIQPGGTVDYPHKLTNNGNVAESVEIVKSNSDADWNSTTLIEKVGTGGVELVDINTLVAGDKVRVYSPDGSTSDVTVTDADGDAANTSGSVEFPLTPGQYINVTNKVFAPADAAQGEVSTTILTAQDPNGNARNTATDTSTVILGQVRLDKTVARQTDCTNTSTIGTFAAIQSAKVEPGQCAVWEIVAKNEGDALVKNVVVTDSIPAYTTYLADSMQYCKGQSCTPVGVTDAIQDDEGQIVNDVVTFYVGSSSTPLSGTGGDLMPGESATVRFTVKIDE